jgi:hypothetical protein
MGSPERVCQEMSHRGGQEGQEGQEGQQYFEDQMEGLVLDG